MSNLLAAQLKAEQDLRLIWCRQATENEHRRWKTARARDSWKALAKKKARQHREIHALWIDNLIQIAAAQSRITELETEIAALRMGRGGLRMEGRMTPLPYEYTEDDIA